MEIGKGLEQKANSNDVVVSILGIQETPRTDKECGESSSFLKDTPIGSPHAGLTEHDRPKTRVQISTHPDSASVEKTKSCVNLISNRPPKIPEETVIERPSLTRSTHSKPKSRLVEPQPPNSSNPHLVKESGQFVHSSSPNRNSPHIASPTQKNNGSAPKGNVRTASITMEMPPTASQGGEDDDDEEEEEEEDKDDEDVYQTENLKVENRLGKKWKFMVLLELTVFTCIMGVFITSLTVKKFRHHTIWGLETWKWSMLVLVIFCGRLFTEWFINILVFLIERNFILKKKVIYFVHGLKKSVQIFIWLALVLVAWVLLMNRGVRRPKETTRVLNYVTRALVSTLIGAAMWMAKTLLIKILASTFHVNRFFDRIQDSIFHQYVLLTLSGPPSMEYGEKVGKTRRLLSLSYLKKGKRVEKQAVDVEKLHKMKQEKISAWTIWGLIKVIQDSGLSTLSNALEVSVKNEGIEHKDQKITNAWEAKAAAHRIFKNVARRNRKYIDEEDLLLFIKKEDVDKVLPTFDGAAETRKIKKASFRNWVVNAYKERKLLAHSLDDTKTAIEELNRVFSGIVLIVIIVVWLLLMGLATTHLLVFITSQLLLVAFIFGNTCKTLFESLIFVFVMHPFDVGDRCVIDGVQMIVEEMNILTTVFLRYDKEMIFYPNSVLATKPISNFYRSPEMSDSVEFAIDVSTPAQTIAALKTKIKAYIEIKPKYWLPDHSVQIKEIENVNNLKIALYVNHTINFQDYVEKCNRRSELVLELKKIFEELGIKFHLLPQEVHLRTIGSTVSPNTNALR